MEENLYPIMSFLLAPITGVASYIAGRRKRDNDFLQQLQSSIDLLSKENKELLSEIVEVKRKNAELECAQIRTTIRQNELIHENNQLKKKLLTLETYFKTLKKK